jgi:hypothetical protein
MSETGFLSRLKIFGSFSVNRERKTFGNQRENGGEEEISALGTFAGNKFCYIVLASFTCRLVCFVNIKFSSSSSFDYQKSTSVYHHKNLCFNRKKEQKED